MAMDMAIQMQQPPQAQLQQQPLPPPMQCVPPMSVLPGHHLRACASPAHPVAPQPCTVPLQAGCAAMEGVAHFDDDLYPSSWRRFRNM
jgi:hypothetical protein